MYVSCIFDVIAIETDRETRPQCVVRSVADLSYDTLRPAKLDPVLKIRYILYTNKRLVYKSRIIFFQYYLVVIDIKLILRNIDPLTLFAFSERVKGRGR